MGAGSLGSLSHWATPSGGLNPSPPSHAGGEAPQLVSRFLGRRSEGQKALELMPLP